MRSTRFSRPSPALVISLVALFVALGGTSYAAVKIGARNLKSGSVGTRAVKNASLSGRDIKRAGLSGREVNEGRLGVVPQAEGISHFAVIRAGDGAATRSRGATSATRSAIGRYQVIFNRDVRGCAYSASLGNLDATTPSTGQIATSQLPSNVNGVQVRTTDSQGTNANRNFHLVVIC
ncbi:MAG: hypothetical protein H0V57_04330 [Thermoleophilaceae bacterium]|nr:hypothetical protein [Thermoleophilaceae bacterium]